MLLACTMFEGNVCYFSFVILCVDVMYDAMCECYAMSEYYAMSHEYYAMFSKIMLSTHIYANFATMT